MDLVKTGRQFGQARTPSLFTSLVNEQCNYCLNEVKMCLSDLRAKSPSSYRTAIFYIEIIKHYELKKTMFKGFRELFLKDCFNSVFKKYLKSSLVARRVISPTVINIKEYISYTISNTPLPPLNNVPTKGFSS